MLLVAVVSHFLMAKLGFGGKREDLSVSAERTRFGVWVSRPDGKKGALQSLDSM